MARQSDIDQLAINTIRMLAVDAVQKGSDRWLEGAASNNAGRTAPLFGSRH